MPFCEDTSLKEIHERDSPTPTMVLPLLPFSFFSSFFSFWVAFLRHAIMCGIYHNVSPIPLHELDYKYMSMCFVMRLTIFFKI